MSGEEAGILHGVQINRENLSTPGTFDVKIGKITDVQLPQMTADTQETTHTDSADGFKEFVTALKDGGEVTFGVIFAPTDGGQAQLRTDFEAGTMPNYQITLPQIGAEQAVTCTFCASITGLSAPSGNIADVMKASVTLKVSGKPVWANWTSS